MPRELSIPDYKKAIHNFGTAVDLGCFYIITKKHSLMKFTPNYLQKKLMYGFHNQDGDFVEGLVHAKRIRWIMIKPRQRGTSTLVCMFFKHRAITKPYFKGEHYLHLYPPTREFARKYQVAYDNLPVNFKSKADNPTMAEFQIPDLGSYIKFSTAGTRIGASRSETKAAIHLSEPAMYESLEEVYTACKDTVPDEDFTYFILETTPMSVADDFALMYFNAKKGLNPFIPLFFPWYEDPVLVITDDEEYHPKTDEEGVAQKKYNLSDAQMKWRQRAIREYVVKDPASGLRTFKREFPESEDDCFASSMFAYFPLECIQDHIARVKIGKQNGDVKPIKGYDYFVDAKRRLLLKDLIIFKAPEKGKKYGVGADCSEGIDKGDFQAAVVIDLETGEQVAQYCTRIHYYQYPEILNEIGRLYNNAVLAVELNNHGHMVVEKLYDKYRYPNLYRSRDKGKMPGKVRHVRRFGFYMSDGEMGSSKRYIIDQLAEALVMNECLPMDMELLMQLLYFEERDRKLGAPDGGYDDLVIALAIAYNCRSYQTSTVSIFPIITRR